jgi:heme/copper-type cytochrome/quinol oxidase subunit 2
LREVVEPMTPICGATERDHNRTMQRIAIAITLVALALVHLPASESVAAQPSPESAATRTYKSAQFKFSFDYPASWSIREESSTDRSTLLALKLLSPDENVDVLRERSPGSFSVEVFANPDRLLLRAWLDNHGWPFTDRNRSVTPTSVGGLRALDITTGQMYAPNRFIYVTAHGVVIRIAPLAAQAPAVLRSFRFEPER